MPYLVKAKITGERQKVKRLLEEVDLLAQQLHVKVEYDAVE